jgi:isobutyryl-CoA mutase
MQQQIPYQPTHKIRMITAASLFDGHDAAINIMRRILQSSGAEVIHLGHNRSVREIVTAAIQEDVQAVAITSYQGGHIEFFKYMFDLLNEQGAGHIKIFGGGGGTILPREIEELHAYGITRIYSPEDGRIMGLQGMINDLLQKADFSTTSERLPHLAQSIRLQEALMNTRAIAQALTIIEEEGAPAKELLAEMAQSALAGNTIPVLGITGTGGAGKSSLTDELIRRFLMDFSDKRVAVISVDPSKRKSGGALLGDRIRMNAVSGTLATNRVFMRSCATRQANVSVNKFLPDMVHVLKYCGFDMVIVETAGIGQSDSEITTIADVALYVMTPEFGAPTQLEKIDMIDYADIIALNKCDKAGAHDALRDVKKQYQRSRQLWAESLDTMPVFGTMASQFNDAGINRLYAHVIETINRKTGTVWLSTFDTATAPQVRTRIIPPERTRYLAEIADEHVRYGQFTKKQSETARKLYQLRGAIDVVNDSKNG